MNERTLYKRTCDRCGKNCISSFPQDIQANIYCYNCWWSDEWNPLDYGMDIDFSRPFLTQLNELVRKVPWQTLSGNIPTITGTEYFNICSYIKNCYMLCNSDYSENCAYGNYVEHSKDSFDLLMVDFCELCYEGTNLRKCHNTFYSSDCEDCYNVYFSENLTGCSNCFGCVNLRKKEYFIFNKQYSKEDYAMKIKELFDGSHIKVEGVKQTVQDLYLWQVHKYMHGRHNTNVTGDYINQSRNTFDSFQVLGAQDCKRCWLIILEPVSDCHDVTMWGGNQTRGYECMACGGGQSDVRFSYYCWGESTLNLEYCMLTRSNSSNLFGCVGLRNKSYCILNKQYTKEEYEGLVLKIIQHMNDMPYVDAKGRVYKYGEFFPAELSLFAYNESLAQEYYPLTKEEALERGYAWHDVEHRDYDITIAASQLSDNIHDVSDEILKEIIGCAHEGKCNERCTTAFRLTPQELQFYKNKNLPLPRLCHNCRHYQRLKQCNPFKLWHRKCQCNGQKSENDTYQNIAVHFHDDKPCPNEFETSYAPERPEIVYCEQCYNAEAV